MRNAIDRVIETSIANLAQAKADLFARDKSCVRGLQFGALAAELARLLNGLPIRMDSVTRLLALRRTL